MDSKTIFSKTAKGLREASGASSDLPRALRTILKEIDGKKALSELHDKLRKYSEAEIKDALERLETEGYARNTALLSQTVAPTSSPPPAKTSSAPPAKKEDSGDFGDLDFTALVAQSASPPPPKPVADDEAPRKAQAAQQAVEAKAREEAETKARLGAEQKAKLLALAKAKQETEEKAKREAEEKARQAALAKAKQEAEEKAKQAALAKAKQEAEEKARQEALAKAKREAEERTRREAEEKARREAEERTRKEAEARAKKEAEERVKREADEKARLEAEVRAKQEAVERARIEAEAKARRDFEDLARKEIEEKARRETEAKTRKEAEARAKQEADEKVRREAEERARHEAEEKARLDATERVRKEAEEKARRDTEERASREAEEKLKREAEEQTRREAEESARKEAEERARQEAEDKQRREAEEKVRREAEEKSRREAEQRASREAEVKARRDAEEQTRSDAEEKERLAAWELSKRKAEEKLRLEAEAKARREAEDRIRIEGKERAEREAEAKLKEALKEKARQEAEERALKEKQDRIRREAEADLRQEAREKAEREARERAEREVAEKAAREAERAADRAQVRWGKLIALATVPLIAIVLGAIHFVPFNGRIPDLEKAASDQFQQPVKIDGLHLALLPQPHWRLDGVTVGSESEIKAPRVNAVIDLGGLFGAGKAYKSVEFESPLLKEQAAGWLLFGKPQGQAVRIAHIRVRNAALESQNINLPRFDAKADIDADGNWQKIVLDFSNKDVFVELHPGADRVQFEINATSFQPPLGGSLQFDDFIAKGTFGRKEMTITEFEGRNFGGSISGNASLKWAGGWSIDGTVNAKQLDTRKLAPALLSGGRVDGKATYAMQAKDARNLFDAPHMEGSFAVGQGELLGVDLMHLLQNAADSGKTGFRELSGSFVREGDVTQLRQLHLDAGIISASGSAELGANDIVRGRFAAAYKFDTQQAHASVGLSGKVSAPQFSRK